METHARVKGWMFTFVLEVEIQHEPFQVIVEGEVGNPSDNTWIEDDPIYYEDEKSAESVARDELYNQLDELGWDSNKLRPSHILWIETAELHPDHYLGKKKVDMGVWI